MPRRTIILHNIDFEAISAQTAPHNDNVFKLVLLIYFKFKQ